MEAFLRELTLLTVAITAACHLLPRGRLHSVCRLVLGGLVLLTLLSALAGVLDKPLTFDIPVGGAPFQQTAAGESTAEYRNAALAAAQRAASAMAEKALASAGYTAYEVKVCMSDQGQILQVQIYSAKSGLPQAAREILTSVLMVESERIVMCGLNP